MCLPSDALSQHLLSYLGFSYLGHGISLHGCSRKAQPLLLTLDEGYLLTATSPDLEHGVAPLGPPAFTKPRLLGLAAATAKLLQSCPTLCDPTDGSPLGSSVSGILQARILDGLPFPSQMHESEK